MTTLHQSKIAKIITSVLPNSAPLSLTPKNLNLVRVPPHVRPVDDVADVVLDGTVVVLVDVVVAEPGKPADIWEQNIDVNISTKPRTQAKTSH